MATSVQPSQPINQVKPAKLRTTVTFPEPRYKNGRLLCGARANSTGKACNAYAVVGMRVCRKHGGATPKGVASVHYKNGGSAGRRSAYMPARLLDIYEQALAAPDKETLRLRDELAVVDARLSDLLGRVDSAEAGVHWKRLGELIVDMKYASAKGDTAKFSQDFAELEQVAGEGKVDYQAWEEVRKFIELRKSLVAAEVKHAVDLRQMLSVEQALTFATAVMELMRTSLLDIESGSLTAHEARVKVSAEMAKLMNAGTTPAMMTSGE